MRLNLTAEWTTYRYAVVDLEGNGQQPPDLVELAVVPVIDGQVGEAMSWLVKPHRPIQPMARRFHKISDAMVADQPPVAEVETQMRSALAGHVLVAHNAHVDLGVLRRELPGFEPEHTIDTLKLARRLAPGQLTYKLGQLVETFKLAERDGGIPDQDAPHMAEHRAAYDALMCARLLTVLAGTGVNLTLFDLLDDPPKEDPDAAALF